MSSLYALSIWIHLVAAAAWVGSMIFFAAVVVPVIRHEDVRAAAPRLLRVLGPRFRTLGWVSLALLIATGISNLYFRGIGAQLLCDRAFWSTSFGRALGWKLGFVGITLFVTLAHEVVTRKAALDALERAPSSEEAARARRIASWVGRGIMLASLSILYFAAALVRGFM